MDIKPITIKPMIIKEALIDKINAMAEDKKISPSWLLGKLGVKSKPKKRPLTKTELIKAINLRLHAFISSTLLTLTTSEVKDLITGKSNKINELLADIQLKGEDRSITLKEKEKYIETLNTVDEAALWKLLEEVTKYEPITEVTTTTTEKAQKTKGNNNNKGNYITIPKEEAVAILSEYYNNLASDATITTPACFRSAKLPNTTQHFGRFMYSTLFAEDCKKPYNLNENVYKAWKDANKETLSTDEVERKQSIIDAYNTNNPDYLETVKGWSNKSYIKGILKNEEVKPTNDADKELEEIFNELEKEQKELNA